MSKRKIIYDLIKLFHSFILLHCGTKILFGLCAFFYFSSNCFSNTYDYQNQNDNSFFFQEDEKPFYTKYETQIRKNKEATNILLSVLTRYDDKKSDYYKQTLNEYQKRIKSHNDWIKKIMSENVNVPESRLLCLHKIVEITDFTSEDIVKQQIKSKYLDVFNFDDETLLPFPEFRTWLDNYVSSYLERGQSKHNRDSLLINAGKITIEKAKKGNNKVFEWIIDYFFEGYESFNIPVGILMLENYINTPQYNSPKKTQIEKRIKGIKTIAVGTIIPDLKITDTKQNTFTFHSYKTDKPYKLLMFWSADCEHCHEQLVKFYPWYVESGAGNFFDVIAISLDETETEIPKWEQAVAALSNWVHTRADGGMKSKEAETFFIVSTPVFIFVDSKTNRILSLPENPGEIVPFLKR